MAFDESRLKELQGALREKMTANNEIADSFKTEDGAIVIDPERKTAFDQNMGEIKEIKSLIDSMQDMQTVEAEAMGIRQTEKIHTLRSKATGQRLVNIVSAT